MKKYIKLKTKNTNSLEISISYTKWWMNYFSGDISKRGYYIYFIPWNKNDDPNYTCFEHSLFWDDNIQFKICIKETTRYNHKLFDDIINNFSNISEDELLKLYSEKNISFTKELLLK